MNVIPDQRIPGALYPCDRKEALDRAYRAPPAVLPSLRSWPGPLTLCATSNAEDIRRAVAAVVEGFAPEQAARDRAASASCPEASPWRFDGPVPRWYVPPTTEGPRSAAIVGERVIAHA